MQSISELASKLRSLHSIVIATHVAPDPDALGSAFGLARGLQSVGIQVIVYCADGLLERMSSFFGGVAHTEALPQGTFDGLVVVDTASKSRIAGAAPELFARVGTIVNIDHHVSNPGWGDFNYIDTSAPASALIVFELLRSMNIVIDPGTASLLFAGLIDDTGAFRFSNTSSRALQVAGEMISAGAVAQTVANALYFNVPLRVLKLRGEVMSKLRLVLNNTTVLVTASKQLLESCGATAEDTEGIIDEARLVEGTVAAVFIRELQDGWKCSLRAKDDRLDVNQVAAKFGGGGHRAAAGCKISGTLPDVESKLLAELEQALKASGVLVGS